MGAEKSERKDGNAGNFQRQPREKRDQGARTHDGDGDFDHQWAAEGVGFLSHINRAERTRQINDEDQTDDRLRQPVWRGHQLKSDIIKHRDKAAH